MKYEDLIEQIEHKISTKQCVCAEVDTLLKEFKQNATEELYEKLRDVYLSSICQCSFPVLESPKI